MLWFTADLHLGHEGIVSIGEGRPFGDVREMDCALIDAINNRVATTDELWILGDFVNTDDARFAREYRSRINCEKVCLLPGNHDRWVSSAGEDIGFVLVSDIVELGSSLDHPRGIGDERAVLCHYPMLDWNRRFSGSYMLHGHIHSRPHLGAARYVSDWSSVEGELLSYNDWNREHGIRRYDIGVDANDYAPVSAADVACFFQEMEVRV